MSRPSWDEYFVNIAKEVAKRGTCDRAQVGAVITKNNRILATGYNGALAGLPHCDSEGHDMEAGHCIRVVHAEINAVAQAARMGHSTDGATLFCTHYPCWNCYKVIASAGIRAVIYDIIYRPDERINDACYRVPMSTRCSVFRLGER